jgi:hypothetical protein
MDGKRAGGKRKGPFLTKGPLVFLLWTCNFLCYYFKRAFQPFVELKALFSVLSPNCFMVSQITQLRKTAVLYT